MRKLFARMHVCKAKLCISISVPAQDILLCNSLRKSVSDIITHLLLLKIDKVRKSLHSFSISLSTKPQSAHRLTLWYCKLHPLQGFSAKDSIFSLLSKTLSASLLRRTVTLMRSCLRLGDPYIRQQRCPSPPLRAKTNASVIKQSYTEQPQSRWLTQLRCSGSSVSLGHPQHPVKSRIAREELEELINALCKENQPALFPV